MKYLHSLVALWLAFCCCMATPAQKTTYYADYIRQAVEKLQLTRAVDTLKCGYSQVKVKGRPVAIRLTEERQVDYIGLPLFSRQLKEVHPSPIYDYLEFAYLNKVFALSDNPYLHRELTCTEGNWNDWDMVTTQTPVTVENKDNKTYQVTWTFPTGRVMKVQFPNRYDRMANSSKGEMERNLVRDLKSWRQLRHEKVEVDLTEADTTVYRPFKDGRHYVRWGESYLVKDINNHVYLRQDGHRLHLIYDAAYPMESLANMLLTREGSYDDKPVRLEVVGYDFKKQWVNTTVGRLMSYLGSKGCQPYFGLESADAQRFSASLYLCNDAAGYGHLLRLSGKTAEVVGHEGMLQMKAYLFIPTARIKTAIEHDEQK